MNKIKRYGKSLEQKACIMRNILKDPKLDNNYNKKFIEYEEQKKLYKKSQFMIKLGDIMYKEHYGYDLHTPDGKDIIFPQ